MPGNQPNYKWVFGNARELGFKRRGNYDDWEAELDRLAAAAPNPETRKQDLRMDIINAYHWYTSPAWRDFKETFNTANLPVLGHQINMVGDYYYLWIPEECNGDDLLCGTIVGYVEFEERKLWIHKTQMSPTNIAVLGCIHEMHHHGCSIFKEAAPWWSRIIDSMHNRDEIEAMLRELWEGPEGQELVEEYMPDIVLEWKRRYWNGDCTFPRVQLPPLYAYDRV